MDKWINFYREKPKKNGEYLCYHMVSKCRDKQVWKREILYWKDNVWLYDSRYFSPANFVNYWMTLPEVPNADNKEKI